MLSITSAQLDLFLVTWMFPLARVLGVFALAPLFSSTAVPRRLRLTMGLVVTFAIASAHPPGAATIQPGSWIGIGVFIQQIVIGVAIGMSMRIVMAALDVAGELIGLQMGLSFATAFDPNSSGQTAVIGEMLNLLSSLTFLALNGHLLLIDVLAHSFEYAPIGGAMVTGKVWAIVAQLGTAVFSTGLLISLPVVAALLITNIALAVLTRTAPQLNLFSLGFPITSTVGYLVLIASLNFLAPALQHIYDRGFELTAVLIKGFAVH